MIIIWSGRGYLVLLLLVGITILGNSILPESVNPVLFAFALLVTAVFSWIFGNKWNNVKPVEVIMESTGERKFIREDHSLFWLKMQYWGILLGGLGLVELLNFFLNLNIDPAYSFIGMLLIVAALIIRKYYLKRQGSSTKGNTGMDTKNWSRKENSDSGDSIPKPKSLNSIGAKLREENLKAKEYKTQDVSKYLPKGISKKMNIIIFGPPLAGKGTQSKKILQDLGLTHLSTGDVLRAEEKQKTVLGIKASEYSTKGLLAPDDLVAEIVEKFYHAHKFEKGILFDGYPRNMVQATHLLEVLEKDHSQIDQIIYLKVEREELLRRAVKRAEAENRIDDRDNDIVITRINEFENATIPAINYFKKSGVKITEVDGNKSIEEIYCFIQEVLN